MEQSVSRATSVNHAAELDQILASYKVNTVFIRISAQPQISAHLE